MTVARIAQVEARAVSNGSPKVRVAQAAARVVSNSTAKNRSAQAAVHVVSSTTIYIPPSFSVPVVNICM